MSDRERFALAIRWLQERMLIWSMAIAFIATAVAFYTHGANQASREAQNEVIAEYVDKVETLQIIVFQLRAGQCPKEEESE